MSLPPTDEAKSWANLLAQRLTTSDNVPRLLDDMRRLGLFGGAMDLPSDQAIPFSAFVPGDATTRIGIWAPEEKDGVRSHARIPTDYVTLSRWSSMERIPAKGRKKRIVYLGESVARGFFFDPHFNPVKVMEAMLAGEGGGEGYEIIDLACNGMFMPAMLKLAHEALALQPSLLVLFAGNNWLEPQALWKELGPSMAQALRQNGGVGGINRVILAWLEARVQAYVAHLVQLAAAHHIPVVVVLPEFNLLDFASDNISSTAHLPGHSTQIWHQTHAEAQACMEGGDYSAAGALAERLIALDGGTTSTGYSMLARCQRAQGKRSEARRSFERSRDAMLWCWPLLTPRCPSVVGETLRREIQKVPQWLSLVDLPQRMGTWLEGELPGRRVFFDYCHLTVEGTMFVAAAMVETILERLEDRKPDVQDLMSHAPMPTPEVIGRAHLFAAMHNASWGQSRELVRYHAQKAAETAHHVALAEAMADLACRRLPGALCKPFPAILQAFDLFAIFRLADMGARRHDLLADALAESFQGLNPQLPDLVHQTRLREHGMTEGVDLLEPYYHISSWCQPETEWWKNSLHFKAYTRESRFMLVCVDPTRATRLTLSCRIPHEPEEGAMVQVRICDTKESVHLTSEWTTTRLVIPGGVLVSGNNEITLLWPVTGFCDPSPSRLADQMEGGELPVLFSLFGEITTFLAEYT